MSSKRTFSTQIFIKSNSFLTFINLVPILWFISLQLSSQASSRATDPRSDNPDEGLTHHREYHSPLASKIATEIKSLNARRSSPSLIGKESLGHTRMTLAELAKMGTTPAVTEVRELQGSHVFHKAKSPRELFLS